MDLLADQRYATSGTGSMQAIEYSKLATSKSICAVLALIPEEARSKYRKILLKICNCKYLHG